MSPKVKLVVALSSFSLLMLFQTVSHVIFSFPVTFSSHVIQCIVVYSFLFGSMLIKVFVVKEGVVSLCQTCALLMLRMGTVVTLQILS